MAGARGGEGGVWFNKMHSVSVQESQANVQLCADNRSATCVVEKLCVRLVRKLIGHQETNWKAGLPLTPRKWHKNMFVQCSILVLHHNRDVSLRPSEH